MKPIKIEPPWEKQLMYDLFWYYNVDKFKYIPDRELLKEYLSEELKEKLKQLAN